MNFSLDDLKKGATAIVKSIHDGEENGILINLGVSIGTEVTMIWPSVLNRPMVIQHGEHQLLAVRREVAQRIFVELIK